MLPPMRIDPTKPCFLDLPGEIRNQIYDHIRKNHFEDIRRNPRQPDVYNNVFGRYRNILKLNKTIHREAASWLWGNYVVSIHKDIVNLESFLRVMPTNASYVEDIALIDFFGMESNQSPVQDWKKRRWSMVEIHKPIPILSLHFRICSAYGSDGTPTISTLTTCLGAYISLFGSGWLGSAMRKTRAWPSKVTSGSFTDLFSFVTDGKTFIEK